MNKCKKTNLFNSVDQIFFTLCEFMVPFLQTKERSITTYSKKPKTSSKCIDIDYFASLENILRRYYILLEAT